METTINVLPVIIIIHQLFIHSFGRFGPLSLLFIQPLGDKFSHLVFYLFSPPDSALQNSSSQNTCTSGRVKLNYFNQIRTLHYSRIHTRLFQLFYFLGSLINYIWHPCTSLLFSCERRRIILSPSATLQFCLLSSVFCSSFFPEKVFRNQNLNY